jgi:hypothetical protein
LEAETDATVIGDQGQHGIFSSHPNLIYISKNAENNHYFGRHFMMMAVVFEKTT